MTAPAPSLRDRLQGRLPPPDASLLAPVGGPVEILRDRAGVPHVYAGSTADLYFGLGFATAQDRLWQLDRLRRRALGRQAEVLGPDYARSDLHPPPGGDRGDRPRRGRAPGRAHPGDRHRLRGRDQPPPAAGGGLPGHPAHRVRPPGLRLPAVHRRRRPGHPARDVVEPQRAPGGPRRRRGGAPPPRGPPAGPVPDPRGPGDAHPPPGQPPATCRPAPPAPKRPAGRLRRRHGQQQLGHRPPAQRHRAGLPVQRPAPALLAPLLLVRVRPARSRGQRRGGRAPRGARPLVGQQRRPRLGRDEQRRLHPRPLRRDGAPAGPRALPRRRWLAPLRDAGGRPSPCAGRPPGATPSAPPCGAP